MHARASEPIFSRVEVILLLRFLESAIQQSPAASTCARGVYQMPSPPAAEPPRRHAPRAGRSIVTSVLLIASAVLMLDGLAGERGYLANRRARLEYERETQALEAARWRNALLREEIRRLQSDPAFIEELARRDLQMIKPGETVFIIRDKR
jgi:cell division protein FtsB